jgi:hypothetical protein
MRQLGDEVVPRHARPHPGASPAHAGLGTSGGDLAVGQVRVLANLDPEDVLRGFTKNAAAIAQGHEVDVLPGVVKREARNLPAYTRFFMSESGAVEAYAPGRPVPDGLQEITREDAIKAWHGTHPTTSCRRHPVLKWTSAARGSRRAGGRGGHRAPR